MSNIENQKSSISADARIQELSTKSFKELLKAIRDNTIQSQLGTGRIYLFWAAALMKTFLSFRGVGYVIGALFAFWIPTIAVLVLDLNLFVCLSIVAVCVGWFMWSTAKDMLAVLATASERLLVTGEQANQP